MAVYKYGTIKGRHELPVENYFFEGDVDPTDFAAIAEQVSKVIYTFDVKNVFLKLYVTGLTCVTAEIIAQMFLEYNPDNFCLVLMHFDRETGEYIEQVLN